MKLIAAAIKKVKLDDVVLALEAVPGFPGMTVHDSMGMDREHIEHQEDRQEQLTDFRPCVHLEILAKDDLVPALVQAIRQAAHTGLRGDGRIWVCPVEEFHDIRKAEE
ncbi:MAG: P-II family nitrogen regulator [Gemmatimonadota bacterium]